MNVIEKDKKAMKAISEHINPNGIYNYKIEILAQKSRVQLGTWNVSSAIVLVHTRDIDTNSDYVDILKLWLDFDGEFKVSCELEEEISNHDIYLATEMFNSMVKFIDTSLF